MWGEYKGGVRGLTGVGQSLSDVSAWFISSLLPM